MLNRHRESFCFCPSQNESGALVCYGIRRFDGIFSNGSCCGLAVICQSRFCICPIPMDTSSFRICFEYIKFYECFSSFNRTFSLLANTLSEFVSTLMFLHEACRSRSHGWIQPNPISICRMIYNLNITTSVLALPFNKISRVLCSEKS